MNASINTLLGTINELHPNESDAFKGQLLAKVIRDIDASMNAKAIVKPALKATAKPADKDDWKGQAAVRGSKQHIRIIAAELAIMDLGWTDVVDGYSDIDMFDTKGDMSDHYSVLKNYLDSVDGIDIRFGSAYWNQATSLLK